MKRIFISITNRVPEAGMDPADYGEIIVLDWDTKKVIYTINVDSKSKVEYGRSRGVGGIAIHRKTLYCVTRTSILGFDLDSYDQVFKLTPTGSPEGFHGLAFHQNQLHIACMGHRGNYQNKKLVVNLITKACQWVDTKFSSYLRGAFNGIAFSPAGDEYHLFSGPKEIYNATKGKIIKLPEEVQAPHDLVFLDETTLLYSRSARKELVKVDLTTGKNTVLFNAQCVVNPDTAEYSTAGWLRGIAVSKDKIFATATPGVIYELNKTGGEPTAIVTFIKPTAGKVQPSPFDIQLHPEDWHLA